MFKKSFSVLSLLLLTQIAYTQKLEIKYCTNEIFRSLGIASGAEVEAAIAIPKERAGRYAGQRLTKIKVGLGQDAATNTKVFIRTSLDSDPVYTQAATFTPGAWNEITLSEPYEIKPDEDLYIGYSFVSGNGSYYYSMGIDNSPVTNPLGDLIKYKVNGVAYPWMHIGEQNFTNLCITGIIEGEELPRYDVEFSSLSAPLSAVGVNEAISLGLKAKNIATDTITRIDAAYKIGTNEKTVQTFSSLNVAPDSTFYLSINDIVFQETGEYPVEVSIEKINGSDDRYPSDNLQTATIRVWNAPGAPTRVSTQAANKNVVLEEFTGVNCQYCPDGHKRANQIIIDNPGRVSVINIHQGSYANVIPDYKTEWGNAIAAQTGLTGYPAGTVNRRVFTGGKTTLGRGDFATRSIVTLSQPSYVNVAVEALVDANTRELTVDVELFYTAGGSPVNLLNVALLQDSILGPQEGADLYPEMIRDGKYQHNHMLRDLLTKQWGDSIRQTAAGTFVAKRYFYSVPEAYRNIPVNLEELEIVAFVAEGKQEIVSGQSAKVSKTSGANGMENIKRRDATAFIRDGSLFIRSEVPVKQFVLYNLSGEKVLSAKGASVDVRGLNPGVYIVKLQTDEGEKVIKVSK